jgi:hypothetical protein
MLRAFADVRAALFVLCGAAHEDPNVHTLIRSSRWIFGHSALQRFVLIRKDKVGAFEKQYPRRDGDRPHMLVHGNSAHDFASFLTKHLEPAAAALSAPAAGPQQTRDPRRLSRALVSGLLDEHRSPQLPGTRRSIDMRRRYISLTLRDELQPGREREEYYQTRMRLMAAGDEGALAALEKMARFDPETVLKSRRSIVILGDPGAGKTTLLLHLLGHAIDRLSSEGSPVLPLYMPLREVDVSKLGDGSPVGDALLSQVVMHAAHLANVPMVDALRVIIEAAATGRLLLMLDGLDEVGEQARTIVRRGVDAILGKLSADSEGNRAIITCRTMAYRDPLRRCDATYEVAPFTDSDVDRYITEHFLEAGGEGPALGRGLIEKLRSAHPRVRELARNPLLVGLLCFYYEERQDLPERRVDLYSEMVNTLLLKWRGDQGALFSHDKERSLEALAMSVFERPEHPLSYAQTIEIIRAMRLKNRVWMDVRPEDALREIVDGSGLFVELSPNETYGFMHLTFQEYFVARRLLRSEWRELVAEHARDVRWIEIWRLMAALMDDADALLEALGHHGMVADVLKQVALDAIKIGRAGARSDGSREQRKDPRRAAPTVAPAVVLHLSDLHFGTPELADRWYSQLAEDLHHNLACDRLDALLLSGDIANYATPDEYAAARSFLDKLCAELHIPGQRIIPVPGNHDLNWKLSEEAYSLVKRSKLKSPPREGTFIEHGPDVVELRDDALYVNRFEPFAAFYQSVRGEPYPLDPAEQALLYPLPAQNLLVLGLNSAHNLDHYFRARASIHEVALSRALDRIRQTPVYGGFLKIAVWHHPVHSGHEDRITDHGFLERLAGAGFRVGLHGHIHKTDNGLFRYDMSPAGRRIELVSAGTFGAPVREWVPGYPLQYQLLRIEGTTLTVETRRREDPAGAWEPDARWTPQRGTDPLPRYTFTLA